MQNLQVPISIVVAGAIVAGAVIFSGGSAESVVATGGAGGGHDGGAMQQGGNSFGNNNSAAAASVKEVDFDTDHVLGSKDAKVTIIEYSDYECPFCSRLHPTLERIVEDFGGEVAWVYRHFPLTSIHSRATGAAVAAECVNELVGNDAFWEFSTEIFRNQRELGNELYTSVAVNLGVSESEFTSCLNSSRYDAHVAADTQNAIDSGGRGTPFSVVINENGEAFPFSGALPYENIRSIVEAALEG